VVGKHTGTGFSMGRFFGQTMWVFVPTPREIIVTIVKLPFEGIAFGNFIPVSSPKVPIGRLEDCFWGIYPWFEPKGAS